ncbi:MULTISPECIES: type II toxin-antitoxin system PemK/MazF family toxin [Kitasatospora]|uniref:type II toxin-antitoxin system PemK/MazF family toxin n=1 Tax=Kitasatospora TaxID=2063 RepID=UPI000C7151E4|nr:type II toxin-antitoxin system PemK/MazF family toxin [Kitasatospora sp. GP30]MDH6142547.1 mRNA-degrading endonuclease toxin of MazEF toxin-antitoxin module [Kitasatospora sp. GP30]
MNLAQHATASTYPLLGLAALVLLVLTVLLGRRSRGSGSSTAPARTPAPRRPVAAAGTPAPREIWWAEVPFEDGPGHKDRPCLVLSVHGRSATVVKITSKHHQRPGVLALPPGSVGDREGRASWLETDELREVALTAFRRRVGLVDAPTWARTERAVRAR